MTVNALLELSGKELETWYQESVEKLGKLEAKAREADEYDSVHWREVWRSNARMFKNAVELKFKLTVIKYLEGEMSRW